jgi:hypothetical protein
MCEKQRNSLKSNQDVSEEISGFLLPALYVPGYDCQQWVDLI